MAKRIKTPKKDLLVIAATHGDEGFSIPAVEKLDRVLAPSPVFSCLGDLLWIPKNDNFSWVIGNPRALEKGVRFIDADLNRVAPGDPTSGKYEVRRAAELCGLMKDYRIVIDVHGASCDVGICAIITNPTPANLLLAAHLPIENVIISVAKSSFTSGSQHLMQHATCGIVLECGPKNSDVAERNLYNALCCCYNYATNPASVELCLDNQNWFYTYGHIDQAKVKGCRNFVETEVDGERFYPLLVFDNDPTYENYPASKMCKIDRKLFEY